jgi:hypothetical protein
MYCFDISRVSGVVVQSDAKFADAAAQRRVRDETTRPDAGEQFLLGDDPALSAGEGN